MSLLPPSSPLATVLADLTDVSGDKSALRAVRFSGDADQPLLDADQPTLSSSQSLSASLSEQPMLQNAISTAISGPLRHGLSKEEYPNGDKYEGCYRRGTRCGEGTYYHADGRRYDGQFLDNLMHGEGCFHYLLGETYDGEWREGRRHGKGLFRYHDGTLYDGHWEEDVRQGFGKIRFKDGTSFEGLWENDLRSGKGTLVLPDGAKYEGEFKNDKRHGVGHMMFPSGSNFDGEWRADLANGDGKMYNAEEQSSYVGKFRGGARNGDGRCIFHATGERFIGQWLADKRFDGHTVLPDGTVKHECFGGDAQLKHEFVSGEERQRCLAEIDAAEQASPHIQAADKSMFLTQTEEEDIPRYKVKVKKFARSRAEAAELLKS